MSSEVEETLDMISRLSCVEFKLRINNGFMNLAWLLLQK